MRVSVLLCALFAWHAAAQPVADPGAPTRRRIQVMDFSSADEPALAKTVTRVLTVELSRRGLDVLSSRDLVAAADLDADRQAAGCDTTSCLMEIAEAMGADLLAYGDVVRLNKTLLVTLNIFDAKAGKAVGRDQLKVKDLDAMPDAVAVSLGQLLEPRAPATAVVAPSPAGPSLGSLVTIAGASVGAVGLLGAALAYGANSDRSSSAAAKESAITAWPWALGALGAGATTATAGAVMWVME